MKNIQLCLALTCAAGAFVALLFDRDCYATYLAVLGYVLFPPQENP